MKFGLQVLSSLNGFKKNISKIEFSVSILPISTNFLVVKFSVLMTIAIFLQSIASNWWVSTDDHHFVSCTISRSKVSCTLLWLDAISALLVFPLLCFTSCLLKKKKSKDCLDSGILKAYTVGLINELVKCVNKVRSKMFSDILYPKILIKL